MEKRRLTVEDLYRFKGPGDAQFSPNGTYVAYVVKGLDKKKDKSVTNIFIHNRKTNQTKQLTNSGKDSTPRFSPDGSRLAFISSRNKKPQVWILPLDGGEAFEVKTKERVSGPIEWTPDGKSLLYHAEVFSQEEEAWTPYKGAPEYDRKRIKELAEKTDKDKKDDDQHDNEVKVITRFKYRGDGHGYYGHVRNHCFLTAIPEQVEEGQEPNCRQLTKGDYDHHGGTLSPDGKYVLVGSRHTDDADHEQRTDLWLIEVETGKELLLYRAPGPCYAPSWSEDGKFIAFGGHDQRVGASTSMDLWLLNVHSFVERISENGKAEPLEMKDATNVTRPLDRTIGGQGSDVGYRAGNWKAWQGNRLLFLVASKGAGHIYQVNPELGKAEPLLIDEHGSITSLAVSENTIAYAKSNPTLPQELFLWKENEEQITNVNADLVDELEIGAWEKITYPSGEATIDGWMVYPSDFDKKKNYPLVLLIHGGPHGAYGPNFMFSAQLFAAKGYVVLYTNPRGSETYGQDFAAVIDKNWGDLDYKDIMAGVDAVIEKGFVDEEQMFVHGWSYGGYMSCWIPTQTDRFKAIAAGASVTNMLSGYGTSDITLADEYEYGGKPWKDGEHLIAHSPIGHVENVVTPMLLMHGENDHRVAVSQTEEFYIALKRLGKEAVMIRYPDEFHGLGRPIHQVDRYERLVAWFEYYRNVNNVNAE
ncbi:S9 family peptidase [Bacillus carboniphilus]|uniref:S9 family peptidase n=2 Tax=Bacillati TaxID=1783272 RepID=A0ABN0VZ89_9BACI